MLVYDEVVLNSDDVIVAWVLFFDAEGTYPDGDGDIGFFFLTVLNIFLHIIMIAALNYHCWFITYHYIFSHL